MPNPFDRSLARAFWEAVEREESEQEQPNPCQDCGKTVSDEINPCGDCEHGNSKTD